MHRSQAYKEFVGAHPLHTVILRDGRTWKYVDCGPKEVPPLICLPGTSGSCYCFFMQQSSLLTKGYRVMSFDIPIVHTHKEFCSSLDCLMDHLKIPQAHFYGVSLGGFLAQAFCLLYPKRVHSLALTNSLCDTSLFKKNTLWYNWSWSVMPGFVLKKYVLDSFPRHTSEEAISNSVLFQVYQLEQMSSEEIHSRLSLNCIEGLSVQLRKRGALGLNDRKISFIDSQDVVQLPKQLTQQIYAVYPNAKKAFLKSGGDFPYISRYDQVNMHLIVHLRNNGLEIICDEKHS